MDRQYIRSNAQHGDGREILDRVVRYLSVEALGDAVRAVQSDQHGIAIGWRLRREMGTYGAAGSRPVVDDDLLSRALRELRRNRPRTHFAAAARRKGNNYPHRLGWKIRRLILRG